MLTKPVYNRRLWNSLSCMGIKAILYLGNCPTGCKISILSKEMNVTYSNLHKMLAKNLTDLNLVIIQKVGRECNVRLTKKGLDILKNLQDVENKLKEGFE